MIIAALSSLSVLLAIWAIYSFLGYRTHKREWKRQAETIYGTPNKRKSYFVVLGDKFDRSPLASKMHEKLQQANVSLTPSEFYGMLILGGVTIAILSNTMFSITMPLNIIIAAAFVVISYYSLFAIRKNKYQQRFEGQLSEVCRLLGNSTRAGMTINQGVELVAHEVAHPAGTEFKRLANELRLGVDFEKALVSFQKRVPSRDFKLFIATLLIQKRAGGNLHAILDEMAHTLEERKVLNQTIKTMTAEQRFISYILPSLPIFLILVMNTIVDDFLKPITTVPGAIISIMFIIGTILTFYLVRKVTNIRV
ncbi:tight adherence protein B [Fictibacillus halophilus]|uniref:Tight adherence protein B n=1 Tax=Fictibacillus halophilus TaxID=1610490 RepID=A0ABV2LNW1_9BACL|nr:type II secretion system F family protein [Fictibacillus halophilus]